MSNDLQLTRGKCRLDTKVIADILLAPEKRALRDRVADVLEREPLWDLTVRPHLNQTQSLIRALCMCRRLLQLRTLHDWSEQEYSEALRLSDDSLPIATHESAFMTLIFALGTDEQREKWLPRCKRYEIIGCYAQTELAHGSNVQGLMTTATYNPEKGEFVVDSGGVEGAKWWIGGAGVLANFAIVQAVLRVPRQSGLVETLGPHLFIVPIRDLEQHLPLPGVTVGDQGPKAYGGFMSVDNGYIKFDSVRIPRENMLMRFAKLDDAGKYLKPTHNKLSYGSMVRLRSFITANVGWPLGKAVTTAIRYCIIRRQFGDEAGKEVQVIEYASVKHRLFPILAQAYCFILGGQEFLGMYLTMAALIGKGDTSMLPEIHRLSTALKVVMTNDSCRGMEESRRAMGGHGFSWMSGVGVLWANWTPSQTYEGDNFVIAQQCVRGLLKHLDYLQNSASEGKEYELPPSSEYLRLVGTKTIQVPVHHDAKSTKEYWLKATNLIHLLEWRCAYLLQQLAASIASDPKKPWTYYSFTTFSIARAHAELYLASTFFSITSRSSTPAVVHQLALLYSLSTIVSGMADFLESSILTPINSREVKDVYNDCINSMEICNVVGLTDAFCFRDWELGVLGGKDGRAYERMWNEVRWREGNDGRGKKERVEMWEQGGWERVREEAKRVLRWWKEENKIAKL